MTVTLAPLQLSLYQPVSPPNTLITKPEPTFAHACQSLDLGVYGSLSDMGHRIRHARKTLTFYASRLGTPERTSPDGTLTPLTPSRLDAHLLFKREDLTATRAYKVRGAFVAMSQALQEGWSEFTAVSTGNHALGVLKAAELLKPKSVQIVIPVNSAPIKADKIATQIKRLQTLGVDATLVKRGRTFDEAREWVLNQPTKAYYIDPYSDVQVVAGQGTIGLELLQQLQAILRKDRITELVVIAPVGGGGLLSGIASAITAEVQSNPAYKHLTCKFLGLRLADLNSPYGDAIRVQAIAPQNRAVFEALGVQTLSVTDGQIQRGEQRVRAELTAPVEGAAAATLFPATDPSLQTEFGPSANRLVVCIFSGGNVQTSNKAATSNGKTRPALTGS